MKKLLILLGLLGCFNAFSQTYSNAFGDFAVEAIDGTKSIYVTGAPFTIDINSVAGGHGFRTNSAGVNAGLYFSGVAVSGDTITLSGEGYNFAAGDTVTLFLSGPKSSIDGITNAQVTIGYPHHEIHEGDHYYIEGWTELDADDSLFVKMVTPDTTIWAHFRWVIGGTGITITTFDEDATGGMTGGSSVTPINNNRNSINTSEIVITSGVTNATSFTTRLGNTKFGTATSPQRAIGDGSSREDEIILKQNTTYLRTFISETDNNFVSFKAYWYEHINKN